MSESLILQMERDALDRSDKGDAGGEPFAGEMLNTNVQVAGDAAALTFNYVSRGLKTGRVVRWNATQPELAAQ
jgi:hypothetical protein